MTSPLTLAIIGNHAAAAAVLVDPFYDLTTRDILGWLLEIKKYAGDRAWLAVRAILKLHRWTCLVSKNTACVGQVQTFPTYRHARVGCGYDGRGVEECGRVISIMEVPPIPGIGLRVEKVELELPL